MASVTLLAFLAIIYTCVAAASSSISARASASGATDIDLDRDLLRIALPENLQQINELIEKADTLPDCRKYATSALLHSCSALEGSIDHQDSRLPAGSDLLLQEESDIYAARLAVCELSGADYIIPTPCRSFVPSPEGRKQKTFRGWLGSSGYTKPTMVHEYYDEVTEANLKQCRKALGSSAQAWTSYSNSRQNAVTMCHAMQSAVERDESRHIAQLLTHTAAATGESLHDAYEQVNQIKQQFHELRTAMPRFQADLVTFDEDLQQRVQDYWIQLEQATAGLKDLTLDIAHASHGMKEARDHLDAVLKSHLPELGHAIATASQQVQDSSQSAAASTELVAYKVQQMEQDLIVRLDAAGYGLAVINDIVPQLNQALQLTVNNTMEFHLAATAHHAALLASQNVTMDNMESIRQKSAESSDQVDRIHSQLGSLATMADGIASLWSNSFEYLTIASLSILFAMLNFAYWDGRARLRSCLALTVACWFIFTAILTTLWYCNSAPSPFPPRVSLWIKLLGIDLIAMLPLMWVLNWVICSKTASPSWDGDYDPFSPPTEHDAWRLWALDWVAWLFPFLRFGRVRSLRKSRV